MRKPAAKKGKKFGQAKFNPSHFINRSSSTADVAEDLFVPKHTFEQFNISPLLTTTLNRLHIKTPTPIQDKIIPEMLKGNDVVGLAETGTGKTAAFLLPLLEKSINDRKKQTLIITPTRELAAQIEAEFKSLGQGSKLSSVLCVGGTSIGLQISKLQQRPNFIIGTPGRLLDLINRSKLKPEYISTVILDEADRMLDMGFINDIRAILTKTPDSRETHLFSATMAKAAQDLVRDFLKDPVEISVKKKDTMESIDQDIVIFSPEDKFEKLVETLKGIEKGRIIIFGAMKHSVEKMTKQLKATGYSAESIHGNKTHNQRKRSLDKFKNGQVSILVATDVAARGIHIDSVSHVINYDLPNTFEDYIHRIGRTGRAQKEGKALTFISKNDMKKSR
ncbi:MAG: DEAD/DEAH box helicase [Patescibacteria group bacterium]